MLPLMEMYALKKNKQCRTMKKRKSKKNAWLLLTLFILFSTAGLSTTGMSNVPNFVLYDIRGKRNIFYRIVEKIPGNGMVILNFTSVHCKPCRNEIPELIRIKRKAGHRVKLLVIYSEGSKSAEESASSLGAGEYAYVDPFQAIHGKFNVKTVPVTLIVNRQKKILGRFTGYTVENVKEIRKIINCN
jgi:thiol-disulfide isomerase/thioredoxin